VCGAGIDGAHATIDAALDGLIAYEFGLGHAHGLREYWRKRHERNGSEALDQAENSKLGSVRLKRSLR